MFAAVIDLNVEDKKSAIEIEPEGIVGLGSREKS